MMKCRFHGTALLVSLCCCFLVSGVCANVAGYGVVPSVTVHDSRFVLDTTQDAIWNLTPRDISTMAALAISPVILLPVEVFFILKLFAYLGYRKIQITNVLENQLRESIYTCIRENPGIQFSELSRVTTISTGSLKYHLAVLRFTNKISFFESTGNTRYFENSGTYSSVEQNVLRFLRNKGDRIIIESLFENPGLSRKDLEQRLNVSGPAISWHIRRLSAEGILRVRRSGKAIRYEFRPPARYYIEKYLQKNPDSIVEDSPADP